MDVLSSEQRRRNMQANKSTATKSEVLLAKALWNRGYRYRKNDKSIFGKPDISLKKNKIAIFCDGEFWHGKDWHIKKRKLDVNKDYWLQKIERNIARDLIVNRELENDGWIVVRLWDKDIKRNLGECLDRVDQIIRKRIKDEL